MTGENEKTTMLQGRGINKYYGAKQQRRQVLHDVDIDVRSGECLAVIGGSGSRQNHPYTSIAGARTR